MYTDEVRVRLTPDSSNSGVCLPKFQGVRVVAFADDGHIKGKLSEVLQVLPVFKRVLKEDVGLELNISKTTFLRLLPSGISFGARLH
jgi:hypothetical protein